MASVRRSAGPHRTTTKVAGGQSRSDAVFTIDDLVAYLKLPKSTVYKLAQEGKIPGQKVGRHWRFLKTTIDDWLRGTATAMTGDAR